MQKLSTIVQEIKSFIEANPTEFIFILIKADWSTGNDIKCCCFGGWSMKLCKGCCKRTMVMRGRLNKNEVNEVIEKHVIDAIGLECFAFANDTTLDPESGERKTLIHNDILLKELIDLKKQIMIYNDSVHIYKSPRKPQDIVR